MTGHNRHWQKRLLFVLMTAVLALSTCILAFADDDTLDYVALGGSSAQAVLANPSSDPTTIAALFSLLNDADLSSYLLSSSTFTDAVTACVANINAIAAEIKEINPDVVILLANQYNPYQWLEG